MLVTGADSSFILPQLPVNRPSNLTLRRMVRYFILFFRSFLGFTALVFISFYYFISLLWFWKRFPRLFLLFILVTGVLLQLLCFLFNCSLAWLYLIVYFTVSETV